MTTLPQMHGWLPARAHARREGVSPSTIRRRAAQGAYDVIPNPVGCGALYREKCAYPSESPVEASTARENRDNPPAVVLRDLSAVERLTFGLGTISATSLTEELGLSNGAAHRTLERMEERGVLRRLGEARPGPRGGRPRTLWTVA